MAAQIDSKLAACDSDTLALLYNNNQTYNNRIYCAMEMGDKLILYHNGDAKIYIHDTKDKLKVVATLEISHGKRSIEKIDDNHFISGGISGYIYMFKLVNNNLQQILS